MPATLNLTPPLVLLAVTSDDGTDTAYYRQPDVTTALERAHLLALLSAPSAVRVLVDGYAVDAL